MADPQTFENVYAQYKNLVYNLSVNYVQNTSDAEDITQEIFVKIYLNLKHYDPSSASIITWIYRIAINHCLDFLKFKKAKKRTGFLYGLFGSAVPQPNYEPAHFNHPGVRLEDKEQLHHLFKLINQLPPNQKTVLLLLKIEGLSQKEVAAIIKTSTKAVEALLQRAKQNLEKKLNQSKGF